MRLITLGRAAVAAAALLSLAAPAAHADGALQPILSLHVQRHVGLAGRPQRVTGLVEFTDPYAGGTYPTDNGSSVLQRRVPSRPWTTLQVVSGDRAGAPVFDHVRRLRRTVSYRLCYRGGTIVTYDSAGHEVDMTLARACSRPVHVRVIPAAHGRIAG